LSCVFLLPRPHSPPLFPYTTLFRSRRSGILIDLSPTEFKLLRYLMLNTNRVLSKSQILDHVWEYDFGGDTGIVESYISYLRLRRSEEHTSELQSRFDLVCRLLLEKK